MMSRLPVSFAAAAAALGLTFITSTVIARPASYDPRAVEVNYGDLDLTSAADATTLYRRIRAAARDACGRAEIRDARASRYADECVAQAIATAVMRVDRDTLTALHRARAPRSQKA
jgi:UrcA family protein